MRIATILPWQRCSAAGVCWAKASSHRRSSVVGDTPYDVRCGKFIGAKTLAVATGGSKLDELQACAPDWAVQDLTCINVRELCGRANAVSAAVGKPIPVS